MSAAGQTLQLLSAARSYRQRRVAVRLAIGMSILPALALVTALISLSLGPLDIPTSRGAQIALSTVGFDFTDFTRTEQLIVDELGFVPFDRSGGELLFNLLAERYERRSTIVTTNHAFGEWVQVFGDEKLATALLDCLGHHAHILTTRGPSYRTGHATGASEDQVDQPGGGA